MYIGAEEVFRFFAYVPTKQCKNAPVQVIVLHSNLRKSIKVFSAKF